MPRVEVESRKPLHVFLGHASDDKPAVRKLYVDLGSAGFDPWLDEEKILPGQDWDREIRNAVRTSDVVLVCVSKSINRAGYLQREIRVVLDAADEQPEGVIFLIPVRLEECDVPDRLRRWQWVNLFEENGYGKLLRALRTRAGLPGAAVSGQPPQAGPSDTASIQIHLFDGGGRPLADGSQVLVRLFDGLQRQVLSGFYPGPSILLAGVPRFNNYRDHYSLIAGLNGYRNAGFTPLIVRGGEAVSIFLMLVPENAGFDFRAARWSDIRSTTPSFFWLVCHGCTDRGAAQDRYQQLLEGQPAALAHLLNSFAIMTNLNFPGGSLVAYVKELVWDDTMQPAHYFAYADTGLIQQIEQAVDQGAFATQIGAEFFHPGASRSFRETRGGEASLLLTFYEDDSQVIDGIDCARMQVEFDYSRDLSAHALLEVMPSQTAVVADPRSVYALRWMAWRNLGAPAFEPPYAIR